MVLKIFIEDFSCCSLKDKDEIRKVKGRIALL